MSKILVYIKKYCTLNEQKKLTHFHHFLLLQKHVSNQQRFFLISNKIKNIMQIKNNTPKKKHSKCENINITYKFGGVVRFSFTEGVIGFVI